VVVVVVVVTAAAATVAGAELLITAAATARTAQMIMGVASFIGVLPNVLLQTKFAGQPV